MVVKRDPLQKPIINIKGTDIIMHTRSKSTKSDQILKSLRIVSTILAHVIAILFPVAIIYHAKPGTSLFSWHPTFMSLAFSFLMTEAILVYSPESSILMRASRKTKVYFHWISQACSLLFAVVGFGIIFYNKYALSKIHFTTWHGLFGLITTIYATVVCLFGIVLLYPSIARNWKLVQLKTYHATFGLLGFTLACLTVALGLYSNWFTKQVSGVTRAIFLFCPSWLAMVVMNQVTNAYLPKIRKSSL